jgi:hypothetical protein
MVVRVGSCKIKVDSYSPPVLKVKCAKFHQTWSNTAYKTNKPTNEQFYIPGVEWILVHRHFTCKCKNPGILTP